MLLSLPSVSSAQLASVGTFQVLKLPLGFIRVLEWVSWNLDVFFLHAITSPYSVWQVTMCVTYIM